MRVSSFIIGLAGLMLAATIPAAAQRGPGAEEAGVEQVRAPIGLVLEPTAYTLPGGQWLISGGTFQQSVAFRPDDRQYSVGIFRGLGNRLHAGAFWTGVRVARPTGGRETENFFGGAAQYMVVPEGTGGSWVPALSLGGYAYGGDGTGGTAYAVASKNLMDSVRPGALFLHAGLRWDFFDFDSFGGDNDDVAPFVGANFLLMDNLSLNAEWREAQPWEVDDVAAFGATYLLENSVAISAGFRNSGFDNWKFFAGLSVLP